LNPIFGADKEGIRGIDHNEVFRAEKSDLPPASRNSKCVLRVHGSDISTERISFFIGR
jgi:hypothetical protein